MRAAPHMRLLGVLLVLLTLGGATGCDRIRDALDGIRRSTGDQWERGRRRIER